MLRNECLDFRRSRDEVLRELREWGFANHDQKPDAMLHHGGEFVRLVTDARIVTYRDPSFLAYGLQPIFVRAIGRKKIAVSLYREPGGRENLRKADTKVAVGEKNRRLTRRAQRLPPVRFR